MKIVIKQEDIKRRNPVAAELRGNGTFRKRVERDRTKYTRKAKHKNQLTA
jgi:stalled ribosome alternative rescue factor ArfA